MASINEEKLTAYQHMINSTKEELVIMHDNDFDEEMFNTVAAVYVEAVDKDGFVFNFDLVWKLAGYSRKDSAKRVLLRDLRKSIDYKIIEIGENNQTKENPILLHNNVEQNLEGNIGMCEANGENIVSNKLTDTRGGSNKQEIWLTARGFNQFVLGAGTTNGMMLRDIVLSLIRNFKKFVDAVKSGEVEIRKRQRNENTENREQKRVKAALSQNILSRAIQELDPEDKSIYARVNGETNKAVLGLYKGELARKLGLETKKVNARDFMTPEQLAFADSVMLLTANQIRESGNDTDAFDIHKTNCDKLVTAFGEQLHKAIAEVKCELKAAKQNESMLTPLKLNATQEIPPGHDIKRLTVITDFFKRHDKA